MDFCYLRIKEFFSITAKFSGTPFFCKMSNTPLRLFDGLLISTEKLVSELLSGIMRALRILSYRILLFICSVLIQLANEAFITVSNSKLILEIVYVALGLVALITSE